MKNTARLIITMACPRSCSYCCNHYDHILKGAQYIKDLLAIKDFPEVCVTGGEPGANVKRTLGILQQLREQGHSKIFLYSAWYRNRWLDTLGPLIDGVHFTIHEKPAPEDYVALEHLQMDIKNHPGKSFRLYIHQSISQPLLLIPSLWKRIESKPWIGAEDCELPANEQLFIYETR